MSIAARVTRNQQLAYFPHTDVTGDCWTLVKRGRATSAGASDGTTLIDTNADSGGADTYSGRYWVRLTSGNQTDFMCRVVDDDGAGTLTFEGNGFPVQVGSATTYEIWLCPDPVVVVDSSSGETDMVDGVRLDEVDDFFRDYYAVPITGTHRGKIAKITSFTQATGTFVLEASFGSALSAGDVVLIRRFVQFGNAADGTTRAFIESPVDRLNASRAAGTAGPKSGNFTFDTEILTTGNANVSDDTERRLSAIGGLFPACGFKEEIGTSLTTTTGSTTTSINVDTATWERAPIGTMIISNNNPAFVTATTDGGVSDDVLTVSPPLLQAPADTQVLSASRMYRKNINADDGDYSAVGLEYEIDGLRTTMTGCRGNVTLADDGEKPMLSWDLQVDWFVRQIEPAPYTVTNADYLGATQRNHIIESRNRVVYEDTTQVNVGAVTASLNNEVTPKVVQGAAGIDGHAGFAHVRESAGCSYRKIIPSGDTFALTEARFNARVERAIAIFYGDKSHAMLGIYIPAGSLIEDAKNTDESGMQVEPSVFGAIDAGTTTKGLAGGGTALAKLPDFVICIT